MTAEYKTNLKPVATENAKGAAKEILEQTQTQLGFVPAMYSTMANSPGFLSTYVHGYNAFRQDSRFSAPEQEVVFLAISVQNGCDYCTAAHSMVAERMSKLDAASITALRGGDELRDAKLQALAEFTAHVFETRGLIAVSKAEAFLAAGYGERQVLEIILAVSVKTLSNYSNHIFHNELDAAFAPYRVEPSVDQKTVAAE